VDVALEEADLLLWVVDASGFLGPGERELAGRLKGARQPVYLVLNKLDLVSRGTLLEKVAEYKDLLEFREIVPVSGKLGLNLEPLWRLLERDAPEGAWAHAEDAFTDQTERGMAEEFIREKVLRKTREEVPHGVAVQIVTWIEAGAEGYPEDGPEGGAFIEAEIVVERAGHRKILLGREGAMISGIRTSAQRELKKLLQRPVRLGLHIKVEEGWRDRPEQLDKFRL
jgi:GTP-binding protein Era